MMMAEKAFVRIPVLQAATTPWDIFTVERLDAVGRKFDAFFKGI